MDWLILSQPFFANINMPLLMYFYMSLVSVCFFFKFYVFICIMWRGILSAYVYMHKVGFLCRWRAEDSVRSLGLEILMTMNLHVDAVSQSLVL